MSIGFITFLPSAIVSEPPAIPNVQPEFKLLIDEVTVNDLIYYKSHLNYKGCLFRMPHTLDYSKTEFV